MSHNRLPRWLRARRADQGGASAVEYGLLVAGIAAMIVVVVFAFGGGTGGLFHNSCQTIFENNTGQTAGSCH